MVLHLASKGYEVVCCTRSEERFLHLQSLLPKNAPGKLTRATNHAQGSAISIWIIGKWEPQVNAHIPSKGLVVVFSVPDPINIKQRPDLTVIDGARFVLQANSYGNRRFSLLLPGNAIYGCHGGSMVHSLLGWPSHEIGEVDWTQIDSHLTAAFSFLKMSLPPPPDGTTMDSTSVSMLP